MRKNLELENIIEPVVNSLGYELVGVEYHANSVNSLLRIFIDKDGGVNLDDCVAVNSEIGAVLDVNDPIPGKYTLEVSSPGLDRPLFSIEDFTKFIGELVKIRLSQPIDRKRNFKGKLVSVSGQLIVLEQADNQESIEINFEQIEKARLIPVFK